MAVIVEDGTVVVNANSYSTDAEFVAYAAARGLTIPSTSTERDILQVLATDYLNDQNYKGYRADPSNQYLSFPRNGVYAYDRVIASDEIPKGLKYAQMEAAIAANSLTLLTNESKSNVQSEEMDVLKVSYFSGGSWTKTHLARVNNYLSEFLGDALELIRT